MVINCLVNKDCRKLMKQRTKENRKCGVKAELIFKTRVVDLLIKLVVERMH